MLYVFEDGEAVIKMALKGRSPTMRHVSRTHRVALDLVGGEKDAGTKMRRKKCDKIEIYSEELVFSCSDKFVIREKSDCIQKSGDTHGYGET